MNVGIVCSFLGGGQWRFGKQVGGFAHIERIMYAENRTADIQSADQNQVLTVACEIHDAAKVSKRRDF